MEALCKDAIQGVISAVYKAGYIEKVQGKGGEYSLVLRNKKSVTLGHSPVYYAHGSRGYAIRQLKSQASMATIEISHTYPPGR